jgi:hypothetical protein
MSRSAVPIEFQTGADRMTAWACCDHASRRFAVRQFVLESLLQASLVGGHLVVFDVVHINGCRRHTVRSAWRVLPPNVGRTPGTPLVDCTCDRRGRGCARRCADRRLAVHPSPSAVVCHEGGLLLGVWSSVPQVHVPRAPPEELRLARARRLVQAPARPLLLRVACHRAPNQCDCARTSTLCE